MSLIKVNCPQCQQEVAAEKAKLNATQGRVDCRHVFQLVKKNKQTTSRPVQTMAENDVQAVAKSSPVYRVPQALPHRQAMKAVFQDLAADKAGKRAADDTAKHQTKPLHYRIPKASNQTKLFAEVGNDAVAFNLLNQESVNAQLPQVSVKPAHQAGLPMVARHADAQKNNITIHTDSLVFTLVGDGQSSMGGLSSAPMAAQPNMLTPAMAGTPAAPMAANHTSEINWTIATIGALVVLILQLFYLIMILI